MKTIFEKMFGQYRGMRRELYILFWGKAATNMGAMIWPRFFLNFGYCEVLFMLASKRCQHFLYQ